MRGHRHTKQRPWHQSERLLGGSARDACCWLCVCWFCRGSHPTPPRRPPHPSPQLRQHPSPDRPARVAAGASWVRGTRSNSCGTATPNHWPQPLASCSHLRMRAVPRPCSIWPLSRPAPPLPSSPASPPLHPAVPACRCFGVSEGANRPREQPASSMSTSICGVQPAVGETVILLHPPLPLVGASMAMERERQQKDSLADG